MPHSGLVRLKSDHFGIEICAGLKLEKHISSLKSDHFGIEILPCEFTGEIENNVKIRPFWD